jgi:hypothetical protein
LLGTEASSSVRKTTVSFLVAGCSSAIFPESATGNRPKNVQIKRYIVVMYGNEGIVVYFNIKR